MIYTQVSSQNQRKRNKMRYENSTILKDATTGKRYFKAMKYPPIPYDNNDIYIITVYGDRIDMLAYEYYSDINDYWILASANNMKGDSLFVKPGTQFRIPASVAEAKIAYEELNSL